MGEKRLKSFKFMVILNSCKVQHGGFNMAAACQLKIIDKYIYMSQGEYTEGFCKRRLSISSQTSKIPDDVSNMAAS